MPKEMQTKEIQEYIRKEKETAETPSKQTLYYLDRFKRIDENPNKLTWNWSAALWTCGWMLYRRMYWEAILTMVIIVLLREASSYIFDRDLVTTSAFVCIGLLGNYLYYAHVKRQLKKGQSRGGIDSISPTILACLVVSLLALAIYYHM